MPIVIPLYLYLKASFRWLDELLRWLFVNVVLGGFSVIISMLSHLISNNSVGLPKDFCLGLTILAVAIAIISTSPPEYTNTDSRKVQKWCRNFAYVIMVIGAVMTFVMTPGDLINISNVNQAAVDGVSYFLFGFAVLCGFLAYKDQLAGRKELIEDIRNSTRREILKDYSLDESEEINELKMRSKADLEYGDLKL